MKDMQKQLNDFLDETMELNDLPGLAVGISIGDDFLFTGARGYRDYTRRNVRSDADGSPGDALLRPDHIFHCASVSKLFTSSAIMKLVEMGRLSLYDRLSNLLPDLHIGIVNERFEEIRLWNMLTHTSGIGDCDDYHWNTPEFDDGALERYVYSEEVCRQSMLWSPQTAPEFYGVPETDEDGNPLLDDKGNPVSRFSYSNVAYEILGHIVSKYSDPHLSYEDFVAEYLLRPAGMTCSTMKTFERPGWRSEDIARAAAAVGDGPAAGDGPAVGDNLALPHEKLQDRSIGPVKYYPYTRQHAPSSTLTANVGDLLKWGRAHLKAASERAASGKASTPCILQRETYDSIWRNYATVPNNGEKMGLGWFMRKQTVATGDGASRGFVLYGHEGTDDGFRASFWICPELDAVTVVLSNLSGAPVKRINKKMFEITAKAIGF